ncbi:DNA-binding transcriptional LysR family regulator [Bacillus pakistanensis]|uniref:DNA-binding transcriptional LysR family regulator n=1 Tax=Rossellomorea pakistanensis TaxID=992288 RepID=A0ABS2N6J8_9BACI|nr:LysR family transcriptional regulator [Bacillus pakistanensis]MBM7583465.1 DNA-binding transcriptional LysR family regulator [Bacillus pakistanensis]
MDQQLQVFVTVVEKKNFSHAAEELHMTQPAVSQYVKLFEQRYGVKLLERSNKFVRLNKAGEIVYHHAKEILALYSKMKYLVDDLISNADGTLKIGASYTYGEYELPPIIGKMHELYPLIKPNIFIGNTTEVVELVKSHQLDVGLVEGEVIDSSLQIEPIAEDRMCIVMPKDHHLIQGRKELAFSELANETWIVRERGSGTRKVADKLFDSFEYKPDKILEFGSIQLIKSAVESGLGISVLSESAIKKELSVGSLGSIYLKDFIIKRNFSIVLNSPFQTKALEVFLSLLR